MKIIHISKTYTIKNDQPVQALKDVSFDLPETGMIFILGRSGSGKSTLLKLLAGLDKPTNGEIIFHNQNIAAFTPKQADAFRNTYCGFIFQEYNLLPELSVGDNVALALEMQGEKNPIISVKHALHEVGLDGFEKRKISELSGGQRQRVAIARTLVKRPAVIFADEPTGALDTVTGTAVLSLLKRLSSNHLVITVTHDRTFAEEFGDRIIELDDGNIIHDSAQEYKCTEPTNFQTSSTRLPAKTAIRVGSSNFKYHPFRLAFTLLLAALAFALFIVPLNLSFWDNERSFTEAVYNYNVELSTLTKREIIGRKTGFDTTLDQFLGEDKNIYTGADFTDNDVAVLQSYVSTPLIRGTDTEISWFQNQFHDFRNEEKTNEFLEITTASPEFYSVTSDGFLCISEQTATSLGYEVIGRLPQNDQEIAIPKSLYNTIAFFGLDDQQGNVQEVNSFFDVIGLQLLINYEQPTSSIPSYVTITGVIDTNCNKACAIANNVYHQSFHNRFFISEDPLKRYDYPYTLYLLTPENRNEFTALTNYVQEYADGNYRLAISNEMSPLLSSTKGGMITMLSNLCLYVGILFFVIAFAFLISFINTSIRKQLKQLGILTALGIDRRGLISIYGSVTLIICGITFILTGILYFITNSLLNNYFSAFFEITVTVSQFHVIVPIILLLALCLVAVLGCILPIWNYKRKYAADLINRGLIK